MKTRELSKIFVIFENMKTQLVAICTALLAVTPALQYQCDFIILLLCS